MVKYYGEAFVAYIWEYIMTRQKTTSQTWKNVRKKYEINYNTFAVGFRYSLYDFFVFW